MSHALIVNGASGRMGRLVLADLLARGFTGLAGHDVRQSDDLVVDGERVDSVGDLVGELEPAGVVVDFSHADATPELLRAVREKQARLVIGTTAQTADHLKLLEAAATQVPIVLARNFSLGINRLLQLLPSVGVLRSDGFDIECVEAHHRRKRDAPSGTATALLTAVLGSSVAERVHGRAGANALRREGEVGVHSLRMGEVPGDHALYFASDHEVIEIRHRALSRAAFVSGVAPAVGFVRKTPPGLYSMLDVMQDAQQPA